ncbi:MAG: hypothetical protein O7E52_16740 [Candidatus Poribacteria bacterium]|nr:hypothetical protein [Candidatus Poribacteria bacterium]
MDDEVDETRYDSPIFQQVIDAIEMDNISPEELRQIKDESVWEDALREDFEEGLQEGRRQEKAQISLSLLREGMDVALIARTTGLNREEIEQLRRARHG